MLKKVTQLVIVYSILTGFFLHLSIITTIGLDEIIRNFLRIILFSACLALALLHIRNKIGNRINYIKAAAISICIVILSSLSRVLWEMVTYLYTLPISGFLGKWLLGVMLSFIPALIVSIFFRKSNKIVKFKKEIQSDILDINI